MNTLANLSLAASLLAPPLFCHLPEERPEAALVLSQDTELDVPHRPAAIRPERVAKHQKKAEGKAGTEPIKPELDRCTLAVNGRTLKPARISAPGLAGEYLVGGLRIVVEGSTVRALKPGGQKPQWTAQAPAETRLVWLAADEQAIYLAGYQVDKESEDWRPEAPVRVRRLDAATGKWLDDLAVAGKPGPRQTESIQKVLTGADRVVALTALTEGDQGWPGSGHLISYRVSCFKVGEHKALWSETFAAAGKTTHSGAVLLWAARSPDKVRPDVQQLTWLGQDVLVCAGPVQDLLCLEGDTGKQRWRVERVWEYERSFIGPSVWQHVFGRSREGTGDKTREDKGGGKGAKPSPARRYAIVGGPVTVEVARAGRRGGGHSIFVAVATGPAQYAEYLSDCVVYELDAGGQPLAMAHLPRMVRGGWYRMQEDGVVWACQGGAFVRLGLSRHRDRSIGMGPGGPDLLCRVDWYRQLAGDRPDSWLSSDPAGDPTAFSDALAFRVVTGGYVPDPAAAIYHFPISMVDLKTGVDRALVLKVPYQGKVPEPKSNYSRTTSAGGKESWQTYGPHVLAITRLEAEAQRLRVTLGMEQWARTLEFETDELPGQKRD